MWYYWSVNCWEVILLFFITWLFLPLCLITKYSLYDFNKFYSAMSYSYKYFMSALKNAYSIVLSYSLCVCVTVGDISWICSHLYIFVVERAVLIFHSFCCYFHIRFFKFLLVENNCICDNVLISVYTAKWSNQGQLAYLSYKILAENI